MSWEQFCECNKTPKHLQEASLEPGQFMPDDRVITGCKWLDKPRKSLILSGETGRGKTYFMYCLMKGIIQRYGIHNARFFKSKQLDDRLLSDLRQYGDANYMLETVKDIPFLFLDDFGLERSGERAEREYYDIIDDRVEHRKPTIISTNLSDSDILKTFGDRIHSRLKTFVGIPFEGEDIRESI